MQQFLNAVQIQFNAIQSKPNLIATSKPSQSSMFSLEGFIISYLDTYIPARDFLGHTQNTCL